MCCNKCRCIKNNNKKDWCECNTMVSMLFKWPLLLLLWLLLENLLIRRKKNLSIFNNNFFFSMLLRRLNSHNYKRERNKAAYLRKLCSTILYTMYCIARRKVLIKDYSRDCYRNKLEQFDRLLTIQRTPHKKKSERMRRENNSI